MTATHITFKYRWWLLLSVVIAILVVHNLSLLFTSVSIFSASLPVVETEYWGIIHQKANVNSTTVLFPITKPVQTPMLYSSFCLLTKDDTEALPEWIAYHYHALSMRRIILAVDPSSKTSPQEILESFRVHFHLNYTIWTDSDYMPQDFVQGNFSNLPNFLGSQLQVKRTAQGQWTSNFHHNQLNFSKEQIQQDLQRINHHRFRQRIFLAECYRQLQQENRSSWTFHIDTDEFVTLNPLLRKIQYCNDPTEQLLLNTSLKIPAMPTSGSLLTLWNDAYRDHSKLIGSLVCGLMPSLQFGARESNNNINTLSIGQFVLQNASLETFRWRYHGEHGPRPKSLVQISKIPPDHKIFQQHQVFDPHIPLYRSGFPHDCRRRDILPLNVTYHAAVEFRRVDAIKTVLSYPLYIYHYLGSLERYLARQEDARRNAKMHAQKSARGSGFQDDGWILGWLGQFVEDHGMDKVSKVLFGHAMRKQQ